MYAVMNSLEEGSDENATKIQRTPELVAVGKFLVTKLQNWHCSRHLQGGGASEAASGLPSFAKLLLRLMHGLGFTAPLETSRVGVGAFIRSCSELHFCSLLFSLGAALMLTGIVGFATSTFHLGALIWGCYLCFISISGRNSGI